MRVVRSLFALAAAGVLAAILGAAVRAAITNKRNDYDGDDVSDIVAVNSGNGHLYRWNGNGTGGFLAAVQLGGGWNAYRRRLAAVGDLNRDGIGDLMSVNDSNGCLYHWLGNGHGGFQPGRQLVCGWGDVRSLVGAGTLLGGGSDLLAIRPREGLGECMVLYEGDGDGNIIADLPTIVTCDTERFTNFTGVGDINGDGWSDLVAIQPDPDAREGWLYRWLGRGNGTFSAPVRLRGGFLPFSSEGALAGMGDLNGDDIGDLVGTRTDTDGRRRLYRWTGNGSGNFNDPSRFGPGWDPYILAR